MRDNDAPRAIRRADYRVPDFLVDSVELHVDIRESHTRVTCELQLRRNPDSARQDAPLWLDGEGIRLVGLQLDGQAIAPDRYAVGDKGMEVRDVPGRFVLRTVGDIDPAANTALEGLYMSHGMYCTQCEAEGFRRITWYPDRPDVLARFRTTIEADRLRYPLLLSNGNRIAAGELPGDRHFATWEDPFPKPCYLFALVAGDLACLRDEFVTRSGRRVALEIYVEPRDLGKTRHAMESLQRAMRWDEEVYGREYDLDVYMIVAVSHFNMGAMENKGLNVFNTACVLASPLTQTDKAFQRVEAVIAHEYFHNWSGNRVTCRDWFQLSLKEGFTVFRDSEFSKDMHSRAVKRIEEVNFLRTVQFPEDAGPLAHPVRPESYVEINNFYTVTIYEKGAEVVRMLYTLLGQDDFRRGCDLYFDRHDGQAATCEDFVRAMEYASGVDLSRFRRWYTQAGTPELHVEETWDAARGEFRLRFRQQCPPTPGQPHKEPFVIPVRLALLERATGQALPVSAAGLHVREGEALFVLEQEAGELVIGGLAARPLPSLLRGFSAPVKLRQVRTDEELAWLARQDPDAFNRWDSAQQLYLRALLAGVADAQAGRAVVLPSPLRALFAALLESAVADEMRDLALLAELVALPGESYLADQMVVADPAAVRTARLAFRRALAADLHELLLTAYRHTSPRGPWQALPAEIARRTFNGAVLDLLAEGRDAASELAVRQQFERADNMTDQLSALRAAVNAGLGCADSLLTAFHARWQDEALVVDQWFSLQVTSPALDALARAQSLLRHPQFELTNPNRVRALVGAFAGNAGAFHASDGSGYRFLAEQLVALDAVNPQIAARLAGQFSRWRRVDPARQAQAAAAMDMVLARTGLSPNLYEVVHKARYDGAA